MNSQNQSHSSRGRPSKKDRHVDLLRPLGVFHQHEAINVGVSGPTLSRLVKEGLIFKLGHGLYQHPDVEIDPATEDFVIACQKFGPQSAIGGPTALFYFNLIDQPPGQIWVLVPPIKISNSRLYHCIRIKTNLSIGIEDHTFYRITNIERTIVESFRYSTKFGLETAIKAAKTAITQQLTTPSKIAKQARALDLEGFISKHWEILITI